jgi:hypothetical protein
MGVESDLKNKFLDSGRGSKSRWCQRYSFTNPPSGDRERSNGLVNVIGASLTGASRLIAVSAKPGWSGGTPLLKSKVLNRFPAERPKLSGNTPMPQRAIVVPVSHVEPPRERNYSWKGSCAADELGRGRVMPCRCPIEQTAETERRPGVILVNMLLWKILVTRVQRKMP